MKTNRLGTNPKSILKPILPTIAAVAVVLAGDGTGKAQTTNDWNYKFAYTLGVQAYIYGFPWINMAQYRWLWVTQPPTPDNDHPYAPLNKFCHSTTLKDASWQGGGSPNTDTLYSSAWLDLTTEPVILSVPAIARYYTFELAGFDSDNFAYVGTRATGTNARNYLIAGPNWVGNCPANVTPLTNSRTPYVMVAGRTLVYDADDLTNVYAIQAQYRLTPLSYWGTTNVPPDNRNVWAPYNQTDGLAPWRTMNRAMTENPPNVPSQQGLVDYFAQIGVGPGQDVDTMDDTTKAGLRDAARDGWIMLNQYQTNPPASFFVTNGWIYPPPDHGHAGQSNDFMLRAAAQSLQEIVGNDVIEAVYLGNAGRDANGRPLSGAYTYTITFPSNGLPDVGAFWSLTMYGADNNFVSNSINRYKVGTYPTNLLATNTDGTLTIYIQHASPPADKASNWLPAPAGGFHVNLRLYLPGSNIVNQTWGPPPILKVLSPTSPVLRIQAFTDNVRVTWADAAALRFLVQFATNLPASDAIPWTTMPGEVTSADGNYSFEDNCTAPFQYYRVQRLP
jgi:hypothetical protein